MRTTAKSHQAIIRKIDILSICSVSAMNFLALNRDDYDRGQLCGFQLSIAILVTDLPNFATNVFDRPRDLRRAA